ncbi:MAG: phosphoglycerate kinase [Thermodesulfobacteriales bacterium]|nr:MAG: phosphoglycerate kinase [Thermodesulfobacteriales bacterium]
MPKLVISDLPDSTFEGKRVFVRVDFNVPIRDGKISEDYRIRRAIPTIDYLIERKAKVIIGTHLGRPKGISIPELSLKPIQARLSELLGKSVIFTGNVIGSEVKKAIDTLKDGEVMLLENLRFHKEETDNDPEFSKELASFADIYVNDAFGTSHRKHASTYGMALEFEHRLAGFLVSRELKFLTRIRENPERPFVVIVGGGKIKDKIHALKSLIEEADKILIGGGVAYTFLKAKGMNIGNSIVENDMLDWAKESLDKYGDKIYLPVDHIVAGGFEKRKNCMVMDDNIPDDLQGFDIGPKTAALFAHQIRGTGSIFWSGPMGVFEVGDFSAGTTQVARAVALATWRGATTVVGGGETIASIRNAEVLDSEITHISTGGGALLEFLGGAELPGISILDNKEKDISLAAN